MKKTTLTSIVLTVAAISATQAQDTILDTTFTGATESGTTASGFAWASDTGEGLNATTSLAFTGSATGFITGNAASGAPIGVAGNIETAGSWTTSFDFTPDEGYDLTTFVINSFSINGAGVNQSQAQEVIWALDISDGGSIFSDSINQTEPGGAGNLDYSFDLSSIALSADTTYTFTFTVSSTEVAGNNIALNQLTLNGTAIPEPSAYALMAGMLGLGSIALRRRK